MTELVITRGLPASGKTTWARAWVAESPENRARINRDDTRFEMYGVYWGLTHWQEEAVTAAEHSAVRGLLRAQISVVVDDTNLRLAHAKAFSAIAGQCGATFVVNDEPLAVPVDACVTRDLIRAGYGERSVGEQVIRKMADRYAIGKRPLEPVPIVLDGAVRQYVPEKGLPAAWLVDIDGTLAHMHDRGPFEWGKVGNDHPNETVADVVEALHDAGYMIVLLSGRDAVCRQETYQWLAKHGIVCDDLLMRAANDGRKDATIKSELFWEHVAPNYRVCGVLDDRQQVVDMWRAMGLTCLQVAPGDF